MCGYNPNPNAYVFGAPSEMEDDSELGGRIGRRMRRRFKKAMKKVGKVAKPLAAIAGPVLMATGVGAPLGAAISMGTAAASVIKQAKRGNPVGAATRLAAELGAGGSWLQPAERAAIRSSAAFRRQTVAHLVTQARAGNAAARIALQKLAVR